MLTENETMSSSNETPETVMSSNRITVALSLLVHGEAVRYNRGRTTSRFGYDFKHMEGPQGAVVPYVSSQCFKKHWRETLPFPPSPIIRERDKKNNKQVNHAYTSGNPMDYVDDDLFGYMIAGATDAEAEDVVEEGDDAEKAPESPDEQDAKLESLRFSPDQLKSDKAWIKILKADSPLTKAVVEEFSSDAREEFDSMTENADTSETMRESIADALNALLDKPEIYDAVHFPDLGRKSGQKQADALKIKNDLTVRVTRLELLQKAFEKGFEKKKKRDTTRRTAPIRMHALVGFSGIQVAQDFQTFSRHVALSGENSVLNPNPVGLYSGWLKTRILLEVFRVGKFYIGGNMDILDDQVGENSVQAEPNPYDRQNATVRFVQLEEDERIRRVRAALQSLGDIGNARGPASSALHDGSLKPRAFIGAMMNCADSPFDAVWEDKSGMPRLNLSRLKAVLRDWDDLFADRMLYIGLAPEMLPKRRDEDAEQVDIDGQTDIERFAATVNETLLPLGFKAILDTPRRALRAMAENIPV